MAKGEVNRGWFVKIGTVKYRIKEPDYDTIKNGRENCIIAVDLIGARTYKTVIILDGEGERERVVSLLGNDGYNNGNGGRTWVKRIDESLDFDE